MFLKFANILGKLKKHLKACTATEMRQKNRPMKIGKSYMSISKVKDSSKLKTAR